MYLYLIKPKHNLFRVQIEKQRLKIKLNIVKKKVLVLFEKIPINKSSSPIKLIVPGKPIFEKEKKKKKKEKKGIIVIKSPK